MFVKSVIGKQFRRPKGMLGRVVSNWMQKGNFDKYVKLIEIMDISDSSIIFEIGFGPGLGIHAIMSKYNCIYQGVDFSELMLKQAKKRNSKFIKESRLNLDYGDFLDFNMEQNAYDIIFNINVIYFWNDPLVPFKKIVNGLKPDGVFHFFMAHSDMLDSIPFTVDEVFNKYQIDPIVNQLKEAGFSTVDYVEDNGYFVQCKK